jgi:hypothetical protein
VIPSCLSGVGKPFIHFFLVGEELLDARALLHGTKSRVGLLLLKSLLFVSFIPQRHFSIQLHNFLLAIVEPSDRAQSLAEAICGWTSCVIFTAETLGIRVTCCYRLRQGFL